MDLQKIVFTVENSSIVEEIRITVIDAFVAILESASLVWLQDCSSAQAAYN